MSRNFGPKTLLERGRLTQQPTIALDLIRLACNDLGRAVINRYLTRDADALVSVLGLRRTEIAPALAPDQDCKDVLRVRLV